MRAAPINTTPGLAHTLHYYIHIQSYNTDLTFIIIIGYQCSTKSLVRSSQYLNLTRLCLNSRLPKCRTAKSISSTITTNPPTEPTTMPAIFAGDNDFGEGEEVGDGAGKVEDESNNEALVAVLVGIVNEVVRDNCVDSDVGNAVVLLM